MASGESSKTGVNETFEITVRVRPEDIDELGHVNNVHYLRWVQEAAAGQVLARARTLWCPIDARTRKPVQVSPRVRETFSAADRGPETTRSDFSS